MRGDEANKMKKLKHLGGLNDRVVKTRVIVQNTGERLDSQPIKRKNRAEFGGKAYIVSSMQSLLSLPSP